MQTPLRLRALGEIPVLSSSKFVESLFTRPQLEGYILNPIGSMSTNVVKPARNLAQNIEGDLIKPLMPFKAVPMSFKRGLNGMKDNEEEETDTE